MITTIKKLLTVALALSMLLSMLSSCDTTDGNDTEANSNAADTQLDTSAATEEPDLDPVDPLFAKIVEKMRNDPNYLIFVIGDSLTQGSGASDPVRLDYTAKFTEKLAKQFPEKTVLRVDGKPRGDYLGMAYPNESRHVPVQRGSDNNKITVVRSGIGGNTVQKIIDRAPDYINKEIGGTTGDLFIIMSGINDFDSEAYDLTKYASPPKYKANLNTLVSNIKAAHPDADIILMTPTTVRKDGHCLDLYAEQMIAVGASHNIPVIDQHKLWMDHFKEGVGPYGQGDWLSEGDSCHPTDVGHEAIADEMIRCLFGIKPE